MANTYLHRTLGSTVTVTTITISCWVKRGSLGSTQRMFSHMIQNFAQYFYFRFNSDDTLGFASANSGNYNILFKTNRLFRDTNAWYHLVARIDTTAAGGNRVKIYVNGEQETSFSSSSEPDQNSTFYIGTTSDPMVVGGLYGNGYGISGGSTAEHFDGSMSHVHFIDGTAYDASAFGETDATTGEWKIKTSPSVTYGNNGFFILKDGNSATDQSGNGNNFTVSGTLTKTEDNPSNVFATMNPLHKSLNTDRAFSNGNNTIELGGTARVPEVSTLGMTTGKFYAEAKRTGGSGGNIIIGITGVSYRASANDNLGSDAYDYGYYGTSGDKINDTNETSFGNSFGTGDIIGIAVDLDNNKIYFSKNGVWQNSGDPTSGSTGTGSAFTLTAPSSTPDGVYFFACSDDNAYASRTITWNYGNGYFETTAVSSAGTNASNNGIFEYDVPTGFTALSTKGLNL